MNTIDAKKMSQAQVDPIEDYLECVTYCSISSSAEENDCQTNMHGKTFEKLIFLDFFKKQH